MSPRELIKRAIALYGSEAKLGEAIGYTQNGIHRAKARGKVTWEMATLIHHVTNGAINKFELCPEMQRPPTSVLQQRLKAYKRYRQVG
jgi:hypothetical protein